MGGYRFPLQKLLEIRIDKEDESKKGFMKAMQAQRHAEEELLTLNENHARYREGSRDEDLLKRRIREHYLSALRVSIESARNEVEERKVKVEESREELRLRQIDRKTVETLRDKREQVFLSEQEEKERKANDEFALYAYIRNRESVE